MSQFKEEDPNAPFFKTLVAIVRIVFRENGIEATQLEKAHAAFALYLSFLKQMTTASVQGSNNPVPSINVDWREFLDRMGGYQGESNEGM